MENLRTEVFADGFPDGMYLLFVERVRFTLPVDSLSEVATRMRLANPDLQLRGTEDPEVLQLGNGKWPYWPANVTPIFEIKSPDEREVEDCDSVAEALDSVAEDRDSVAKDHPDGVLGYLAELEMWRNMRGVVVREPQLSMLSLLRLAEDEFPHAESTDGSSEVVDSGSEEGD